MTTGSRFDDFLVRLRGFYKPHLSVLNAKYSPLMWYRNWRADVLLVWFPTTGGTWTTLLLSSVLSRVTGLSLEQPLRLEKYLAVDPRLPLIRPFHEDEPHWKHPHQLATDKSRYRDKKVILLVRDPRDTMVSLHLQMTKRWRVPEKPLEEFIWQSRGSLESMLRYYNIWADNRRAPDDLLLVRYEDLRDDPHRRLREMLDFCNIVDVPQEFIDAAVEENQIDRMREREAAGQYKTHRLRPGDAADPESFKARRGVVGGYVDYLTPHDVEAMSRLISERLDEWYGYR